MIEEYRKVTVEDIQRVVKKYMRPINRTVLTVVPDNEAEPVDFAVEGGE
jgi:predicted Zn-dependent peptidase